MVNANSPRTALTGAPHRRGIVFTPAELQEEGLEWVLESVTSRGVNAVALTPGVFLPSDPERGVREPPLDVDGHVRRLDRPLWGSHVAHVDRYAPYEYDEDIWAGVPYPPPKPAPLEHRVDLARSLLDRAPEFGLEPYVILSPTVIPGLPGGHSMSGGVASLDTSERPVPVAGSRPERIIAGQGCPNHPKVQALIQARVQEAARHYPDAAGFFFDWIEYTCYFPQDVFTCFCCYCEQQAQAAGLDWEAMRVGVRMLWDRLHALSRDDLTAVTHAGFLELLEPSEREAVEAHQRFKAATVARVYRLIRGVLQGEGCGEMNIGANGFPEPWGAVTGAALATAGMYADTVRPKFFTFHWAMMVRWFGETLQEWNPHLSEAAIVQATLGAFRISGGERPLALEAFGMPRPEEHHPLSATDVVTKIDEISKELSTPRQCEAYLHGYQPADEFDHLLGAVGAMDIGGIWVQRYGYLSDKKLEILGSHWGSPT